MSGGKFVRSVLSHVMRLAQKSTHDLVDVDKRLLAGYSKNLRQFNLDPEVVRGGTRQCCGHMHEYVASRRLRGLSVKTCGAGEPEARVHMTGGRVAGLCIIPWFDL